MGRVRDERWKGGGKEAAFAGKGWSKGEVTRVSERGGLAVFACLLADLLVCSLACLLVGLLACLLACLPSCLLACLPACLPVCLPACLLACYPSFVSALSLGCWGARQRLTSYTATGAIPRSK